MLSICLSSRLPRASSNLHGLSGLVAAILTPSLLCGVEYDVLRLLPWQPLFYQFIEFLDVDSALFNEPQLLFQLSSGLNVVALPNGLPQLFYGFVFFELGCWLQAEVHGAAFVVQGPGRGGCRMSSDDFRRPKVCVEDAGPLYLLLELGRQREIVLDWFLMAVQRCAVHSAARCELELRLQIFPRNRMRS